MKPSLRRILNLFIFIVSFVAPVFIIVHFGKDIRFIEKVIPNTGVGGPIISILFMGLLSATPIPTDPIIVLNGAIFGPWMGMFVSWMGNNLAAIIEYFIGIGIGKISDFDRQKKRLPFGLSKFSPDSPIFLIFGRFIPQFGGKLVSVTSGVYRVKISRYLWTTLLSNLIGAVILAYGGHALLHSLFVD